MKFESLKIEDPCVIDQSPTNVSRYLCLQNEDVIDQQLRKNKTPCLPSTPSSISSKLNTGKVGSTSLLDFFLLSFLPDLELFFRDPPKHEDRNPGFLCLGLRGGSQPYKAVLLKTHPVPTYTGPWIPSNPLKFIYHRISINTISRRQNIYEFHFL